MATQPLFSTDDAWDAFITNELLTGNGTEWRLAERLASPEFNDEQRREIVTRLLTDELMPGRAAFVLADDPGSAAPNLMEPGLALSQGSRGQQVVDDQIAIAGVIDEAFRNGEITAENLIALGSKFEAGHERVASLLGRERGWPGGAAEGYALALLAEYPLEATHDDASAALDAQGLALSLLANDPLLREEHFGEGSNIDPRQAFETLVTYNDRHPYNPADSLLRSGQAADGVMAATHLYAMHADTLLPHYTGLSSVEGRDPPQYTHNKDADTGVLARFFEQTVTNEDTRSLPLAPVSNPDDHSLTMGLSVVEAVGQTTVDHARGQLREISRIDPSDPQSVESVVTGLGTLQGALLASSDLAMDKARAAGEDHDEAMRSIGAGANWVISQIPLPGAGLAADAVESKIQRIPSGVPIPTTGDPKALGDAIYRELGVLQRGLGNDPDREQDSGTYFNWADYFEKEVVEGRAAVESDLGSGRPSERHFDMSTSDTSQHSSLTTPTVGATDIASLTSPGHPDFARYAASLHGCEGCRLPIDDTQLANLASTVALRSREAGLPSVDHVVASPGGERVFAVAGRLDDPAHLRISVPVDEARERSVETNSREWAELQRTRTAETKQDAALAQHSAMRMA